MKDDVVTVKDTVEAVLQSDARARDDDKWLTIQVLRKLGFNIYIPYETLESMPSFESIRRTRQKFQEQGLYQPSPEVADGRKEEEVKMRRIEDWFSDET
jgi:hypothetical protein